MSKVANFAPGVDSTELRCAYNRLVRSHVTSQASEQKKTGISTVGTVDPLDQSVLHILTFQKQEVQKVTEN